MGILRLLLAISVVFAHSSPPFGLAMTNGPNSVQAFYIISGFLITLVLNERYDDLRVFYTSRLLRIFPTYWLWLVLTIAFIWLLWMTTGRDFNGMIGGARELLPKLDPLGIFYVIFSNIFLIGQEWQFHMTYDANGVVRFAKFFWAEKNQLLQLFPVGPAWSLSVELMFYAIAPFVVRSIWRIAIVFALAIILRWCAFRYNFGSDPYTYRFFPIEAGTFMIGAASFHLYRLLRKTIEFGTVAPMCAAAILWIVVLIFAWLPSSNTLTMVFSDRELILYVGMFALLPLAFMYTSAHPVDRLLGEISFPLYLCHYVTVFIVWSAIGGGTGVWAKAGTSMAILCLSLIFAALTYIYVDRPIDRIRHRIGKKERGGFRIAIPQPRFSGPASSFAPPVNEERS